MKTQKITTPWKKWRSSFTWDVLHPQIYYKAVGASLWITDNLELQQLFEILPYFWIWDTPQSMSSQLHHAQHYKTVRRATEKPMPCIFERHGWELTSKKYCFFPKSYGVFKFFFWLKAIWEKTEREKRRIKHFSGILSESTQMQLAFKHYFTCLATGNTPHTLSTFFKKVSFILIVTY